MESKKIRIFLGSLFTLLAMIAGILIVCFTAPRPRMFHFKGFFQLQKI